MTSFSRVDVQTIESLQATSFALSEITTRSDIMTNNAQNVAAAKAEEMAAILTEKSEEGSNTVDVESSGLYVQLNIVGNLKKTYFNMTLLISLYHLAFQTSDWWVSKHHEGCDLRTKHHLGRGH